MIEPRDVTLTVPEHKLGEPYRIKLTHRRTGQTAEASGADWNEAKAAALEQLERELKET